MLLLLCCLIYLMRGMIVARRADIVGSGLERRKVACVESMAQPAWSELKSIPEILSFANYAPFVLQALLRISRAGGGAAFVETPKTLKHTPTLGVSPHQKRVLSGLQSASERDAWLRLCRVNQFTIMCFIVMQARPRHSLPSRFRKSMMGAFH
jgi:hypothetical protein